MEGIALGMLLIILGGFVSASFYTPMKPIENDGSWHWESFWLGHGLFAWLIAPWVIACILCPGMCDVLKEQWASEGGPQMMLMCVFYGALWGVGGLTFGLSMRYLGVSLGIAIALGCCTVGGTILPPLLGLTEESASALLVWPGNVVLGGLIVCLIGIAVIGLAGVSKEKELSSEQKQASVREFNFGKGMTVALFAGVMSGALNIGLANGGPIEEAMKITLETNGGNTIFRGLPVIAVTVFGGFLTNLIWCLLLFRKNGTGGDWVKGPVIRNWILVALAGLMWYGQFFFMKTGDSQLGAFKYTSFAVLMASSILFSTLWGLWMKEWKGCGKGTMSRLTAGLAILVIAMVVIGIGNKLKEDAAKKVAKEAAAEQCDPLSLEERIEYGMDADQMNLQSQEALQGEAPAEPTPAPEVPAEPTPAPEAPAEPTPAPETPAEPTPAPETPAEPTPAPEAPAEPTPAPETPAEPTPAPEAPAEPAA